jgi:uncharacterized protein
MKTLWLDYKSALIAKYGEPVYRIGVDGGFSCPNRNSNGRGGCIYCDVKGSSAVYQRKSESNYRRNSGFVPNIDSIADPRRPATLESRKESILQQIQRGAAFIDMRYPGSGRSMYFQAFTNTFDTIQNLRELYDCALSTDSYREFIVSTRPDCLSPQVVQLLESYKSKVETVWVELGLQSGNDETLQRIGRGHTVQDFSNACARLHEAGINISAHVILGLPGETYSHIECTAAVIRANPLQAIKIHNLHVVAGTQLFDMYAQGELSVASMDRHLSETIFLLRRIPSDIAIQRFVSDTPMHRLAAPRSFGDKGVFLNRLRDQMEKQNVFQGDLVW